MRRHKVAWFNLMALVLTLVLLVPIIVACGGEEGQKNPTLEPTATQTQTPLSLPPDWTYYTVDKLQIGLPNSWITADMTSEQVDALIEEIGDTNPEYVQYLEAAKQRGSSKLTALDPTASPKFCVNLQVDYKAEMVPP